MVLTVAPKEQCLALRAGVVYEHVTVMKVNKTTARVKYPDKTEASIPLPHLWKQKKKRNKKTSRFSKPAGDKYTPRPRDQRFALARRIAVKPVCFGHGFMDGDYFRMLSDQAFCQSSLCIFNDNTPQWERHGSHPTVQQGPGGGNACARPWQHIGHAIGMPTGPFRNLTEVHHVSFAGEPAAPHTAKEIIDEATKRIVHLCVQHPEKETIYFSVDTPDSVKIGLAIFRHAVGDDVVDYISAELANIPRQVRLARLQRAV
jgi:hypothetical protein